MSQHDITNITNELRKQIITMIHAAGSGHPGGSLSLVEVLTVLYYKIMNIDSNNPGWIDRDRLVLSKGHGAPALYAVLAEKNFFPKQDLLGLRKLGNKLQGHPDFRKVPGIDASTGSLGQGLSIAVGMALAAKQLSMKHTVYSIIGDGECQEGLIWEAIMAASHYKLDNLTIILDYNKLQIDGTNSEVMSLGDISAKFKAFGCMVEEVDGHNVIELEQAFKLKSENRPKCIVANTVKGKGVSFMEDNVSWHGKAPNDEEYEKAMHELEAGK